MFKSLALVPFVLTLVACADVDGGSTTDSLRSERPAEANETNEATPTRRVRIETCMEAYGGAPEQLPLGIRLELDVPNGYAIEDAFGLPAAIVPDWSQKAGARGRTIFTFDSDGGPIEKFLRVGRFHFVKNVGGGATMAKSCAFEVVDPQWTRVRATEWMMGDSDEPAVEAERDLGTVALDGGLLLEAYPFSTSDSLRTELLPSEGALEPVRTTSMRDPEDHDIGSGTTAGTHVFQVEESGEYHFDVLVFAQGYGNVVNHVRVRFE